VSLVKSVEYVEVSITAASEPVTTNLTKGQDETQCVPFYSVRTTGAVVDANENFLGQVEIIDNAGTPAVRVSASARTDANTSVFQIFVVEWDISINVQQIAVTGFTNAVTTLVVNIAEVDVQTSAFLIYSYQYTSPPASNDDYEDAFVRVRFNGASTTQVQLSRRDTDSTVNGTLYVVDCDFIEFTVRHAEVSTAAREDIALSINIPATVLADSFILHSYDTGEGGDDPVDGAWMADLEDTTTVRLRRTNAGVASANSTHSVAVVECQNSQWDVQRGQVTMALATETDTITAIDQARSIISLLDHSSHPRSIGRCNSASGGIQDDIQTGADFSANTTVRLRQRVATVINDILNYEVIQFVLNTGGLTVSVVNVNSGVPISVDVSAAVLGTGFEAVQGTGTVKISPTDNVADAGAVTQTVTLWEADEVTFTVVQGALAFDTNLFLFVTNDSGGSNPAGSVVQITQPYKLDFAENISVTFDMPQTLIPDPPPPSIDINDPHFNWFLRRW